MRESNGKETLVCADNCLWQELDFTIATAVVDMDLIEVRLAEARGDGSTPWQCQVRVGICAHESCNPDRAKPCKRCGGKREPIPGTLIMACPACTAELSKGA
jgi:hypothetical protein